jgi:hypothetical protein
MVDQIRDELTEIITFIWAVQYEELEGKREEVEPSARSLTIELGMDRGPLCGKERWERFS